MIFFFFFFSSRRRHTRCGRDWSSDVCSSDLKVLVVHSDLLAQIEAGIPDRVKVLVVPTPDEIARAYGVPDEGRRAPSGVETWDAFVARTTPRSEPPKLSRGSMIYTSGTT